MYLFHQHHAATFVPASDGKTDQQGHLLPQIHNESHSSSDLCLVFYLKAYLHHAEPFRKKSNGFHVFFLFLGNSRQHMPKMFFSCMRKVLCNAKAHMSPGAVWGAAGSVTGVYLASILQVGGWARVSTPARHCFSTYMTTTDWHQDCMQCAVLGLSE